MTVSKRTLALFLALGIITALFGCSKSTQTETGQEIQGEDFELELISNSIDASSIFTSRDKSGSYDDNIYNIELKDNGSTSDCETVDINSDNITITKTGTYRISGTLSNGQIIIDASDTDKIQLALNNVSVKNNNHPAINVINAKKVFITCEENTDNYLETSGEFDSSSNEDGVIYSKDNLTVNGNGALEINSSYSHAIVCNDDLVIAGANITADAKKHCVKANDSILLTDATLDLMSGKDAIHCDNDEDTEKGYIYLADSNITINADDDGIHASNYAIIDSGKINIEKCNEGIEAKRIEFNSANVNIVSDDDGINAASSDSDDTQTDNNTQNPMKGGNFGGFDSDESCYVNIAGGEITVNANGDGIDSNGYICQTGGSVTVYGCENGGNGAFDYGLSAKITGGTAIAFGYSSMSQGYTNSSTQCSVLINFDSYTNESFTLKDSDGNEIASVKPEKEYNSVMFSSKDLSVDNTYSAIAGNNEITIKLTSTAESFGNSSGTPGGKGRMNGEQRKNIVPNGNTPNNQNEREMPTGTPPDNQNEQQAPDSNTPQMPTQNADNMNA
ncbi:MAG: carbohydrate-binding domain-containing protein [Eubacterium sp.]